MVNVQYVLAAVIVITVVSLETEMGTGPRRDQSHDGDSYVPRAMQS